MPPNRPKPPKCKAITKKGTRCNKTTTASPYCWIHLRALENLIIKPSTIPNAGLGLFTTKSILIPKPKKKKGKRRKKRKSKPKLPVITAYAGPIVRQNPQNGYTLKIAKHAYMDGSDPNSSAARFSNTCKPKMVKDKICVKNAKFVINKRNKTATMKATKDIVVESKKRKKRGRKPKNQPIPATEIFVDYGQYRL